VYCVKPRVGCGGNVTEAGSEGRLGMVGFRHGPAAMSQKRGSSGWSGTRNRLHF
jgi:hypothetical protein